MVRRHFLLWCAAPVVAGCAASSPAVPDVLLFNGRGTSPNDVAALEAILRERGVRFSTMDSARLDAMSELELGAVRLLIIPGGDFEDIGNGLTPEVTTKLRRAIERGVGYLGVCAGAFIAGPAGGHGLNLTEGVTFPFYALEDRGVRKAPVTINTASGATLEVYWEDGPQLAGWGQAVARYADGAPAVVQGRFGNGWVVLTGVHPEAPESWRRGLAFRTAGDPSRGFAGTLVEAALMRTALPHD